MSRLRRLVIGAATLFPLVAGVALNVALPSSVQGQPLVMLAFLAGMPAFVGVVALIVFYLRHLGRNECVSSSRKGWWGAAFVFLTVLAMLPYWYRYIWRDDANARAVPS